MILAEDAPETNNVRRNISGNKRYTKTKAIQKPNKNWGMCKSIPLFL